MRVSIDKNKKFSENYYFENNKKRLNFKKEENIKIKEIIINNDNKILLKNYFKLIISYQIKKNEQNDIVTNIFDINLKQNLDLFREKLIKEILKNNNFSSNFLFINKEKKEINKNFEKNLNINDIINENKITIVILPMINIIKGQQFILSLNISINENLIFFRENINYHNFSFLDKNKNCIEKNNEKNKKIKDIIKGNDIYIEDDEEKTELILFNKNNINSNNEKINNQLFIKAKNKLNEKNILELKKENLFSFRTEDNIEFFPYKNNKELNSKLNENNFYNLLFIGEKGSQKTKFINFFVNYLLNIKNDNNFRFHLNDISKFKELNPDIDDIEIYLNSNINDIEIYYISNNYQTIRIINIREFDQNNYKNIKSNIIEKIKNLFEKEIKLINSICFLINCENSQLIENNEILFENIMNIFDKEFLYNINFIFSHSLDKIEKFLNNLNTKSYFMKKIINEINEKKQCFFYFDNSILLSKNKEKWNNQIKNFNKFFNEIKNLKPIKINKCINLINYRIYIEGNMDHFKYEFKKFINEEDEIDKILDNQNDIISENNNLNDIYNQNNKIDEYRYKTLINNINQFKINFYPNIFLFEKYINYINSYGINKNDFIGVDLLITKIIENKEEKSKLNKLFTDYFKFKKKYYEKFKNNENNKNTFKFFIKDTIENTNNFLCTII